MKHAAKKNLIIHGILLLGVLWVIGPFIWMVLSSFKTFEEITRIPITILPEKWVFRNYPEAFTSIPFGKLFYNTFVMAFFRILCAVIFSNMAGYAFSRIKFPGRDVLFYFVLFQMMVPNQIFIIPQYLILAKLGMLNTIFALIFPALVSAYATFLLKQFYATVPGELEEAGILDGCNKGTILFRIYLPLAKSTNVAVGIFTLLFSWKNLMWPLIVNGDLNKMTLSSGLSVLSGQHIQNLGLLMAGGTITVVPLIIIYIIFQNFFITGMAGAGIKG